MLVYEGRVLTFGELLIQLLIIKMDKVQDGIAPDNTNDIFRERHMKYKTRKSSSFETKNTKTVHY